MPKPECQNGTWVRFVAARKRRATDGAPMHTDGGSAQWLCLVAAGWLHYGRDGRATVRLRLVVAHLLVSFPRCTLRLGSGDLWARRIAVCRAGRYQAGGPTLVYTDDGHECSR